MRNLSNGVRDMFGRAVDSTLGKLGVVGEFLGGALKRIFDYSLMLSPYGFAVLEEELGGMASMYGMTVDAIFNPDPSRYERLGKMISGMPEYFAHMSASEWGSLTVDVALSLVTEGEALAEIGERAGARILGRLQKFLGRSVRSVGGLRDSPMRILTAGSSGPVRGASSTLGWLAAASLVSMLCLSRPAGTRSTCVAPAPAAPVTV